VEHQENMTFPKAYNSSITEPKDIKVAEMQKIQNSTLKNDQLPQRGFK
jgi:hypothetical protein